MIYLLLVLLVLSACFNLYALMMIRKHRGGVKYMRYEFDRFAADAEERIDRHEGLIRDTRDELKSLETDAVESVDTLVRAETPKLAGKNGQAHKKANPV